MLPALWAGTEYFIQPDTMLSFSLFLGRTRNRTRRK